MSVWPPIVFAVLVIWLADRRLLWWLLALAVYLVTLPFAWWYGWADDGR